MKPPRHLAFVLEDFALQTPEPMVTDAAHGNFESPGFKRALDYYLGTMRDGLAPVASGSNPADAMAICPCSMGTLAAVAAGLSDSLIERAADVMLKEKRKLVIVPRETPFSTLHLENMLRLSNAGAVILPANPGFYHHPKSVDELVDFIVARVLDQLGVTHTLMQRWGHER